MVLAGSHGIPRVPRYSGAHPSSQIDFVYRSVTFYGATFQRLRLSIWLITRRLTSDGSYNPREHAPLFGLIRVRSPLLAESLTCFLLLEVLRWFTSLRCLRSPMNSARDTPV